MIEVSIRLRRAIHLNDLVLVKRIVNNNPKAIQNPDFTDNGNTSLHLAAKLGFLDIAEFLIDAGHEGDGISRNFNWDTPLHLAVESSTPVASLLATRFPRCVPFKNKQGADALMLASRTPHSSPLLPILLSLSPLPPHQMLSAADNDGNTALHYATAYGQLKCIRTLLGSGASAGARNNYCWTPVSYSSTVQAEVYFRGLVGEGERRRRENIALGVGVGGGVRLVEEGGKE